MTVTEQIKQAQELLKNLKAQIVSRTFKNKITVKIGEKGTLNFYGLQKFPVCLYFSQVAKIQEVMNSEEFKQFVIENADKLAKKSE
jgi:hypothetical protein